MARDWLPDGDDRMNGDILDTLLRLGSPPEQGRQAMAKPRAVYLNCGAGAIGPPFNTEPVCERSPGVSVSRSGARHGSATEHVRTFRACG
jgi:hypothetical protein